MRTAVAAGVAGVIVLVLALGVGGESATAQCTSIPAATAAATPPAGSNDVPELTVEQQENATTIMAAGRRVGVSDYGLVIAIATAMQESTLRNLSYGDRDSLGLFQQRASWGTVTERTTPEVAAEMFYTGGRNGYSEPGLLDIPEWESMSVAEAAQAVQRSAYPDAYAKWESLARAVVGSEAGPASGGCAGSPIEGWTPIVRQDFRDMTGVDAWNSKPAENSKVGPNDRANDALQPPTVASNVTVIDDPGASDGKALAVYTRQAAYRTLAGTAYGWTNGRFGLQGGRATPPVRIRARIRFTRSVGSKAAVMWYPTDGWRWEVDFAETFGGETLDDDWGAKRKIGQRWHGDYNPVDGRANEHIAHDDRLDATQYHVYDLVILPDRMWVEIDGAKTFETTRKDIIPNTPGYFTVGKALTDARILPGRTEDAVILDWVDIHIPNGTPPA